MEMKIRTPTTNPFLAPKARLRKARRLDSFHSTGLANSASSINIVGVAKTNTDKALTQPAAFVATNNKELARLQPVVNSRVLLSPEFNSDYPFVTRASAAHPKAIAPATASPARRPGFHAIYHMKTDAREVMAKSNPSHRAT